MKYLGAAYYPEHWPRDRWEADVRLMAAAHLNVVRLGEFAWCRMEPAQDRFELDWLADAVALLHAAGIGVVLGTPTAGPPAWLVNAEGDADCRIDYEQGGKWQFGGRSMCCPAHPRFQDRSRAVCRALAERFAAHPAIVGWQLDNELGMYGVRCHCPHCVAGFRAWLHSRFGTVESLNERLGMVFGSGEFASFDDVPLPRLDQDLHSPGLLMESVRFYAAANARYLEMQAETLREAGAAQPITTNVCHMLNGSLRTDEVALFGPLDVVAWDCYPQQFGADPAPQTMGFLHTVARGIKRKPFWLGEQQAGGPFGMPAVDARRIRLWTYQSLAHGAELVLYFRWRTARFGGEQYWRGILGHTGTSNERYAMVARVGEEVARLREELGPLAYASRAAILLDPDDAEALSIGARSGAPRLRYRDHAEPYYDALRRLGHTPAAVFGVPAPGAFDLLVAPAMRLMSPERAARLAAFVEGGGTLVTTVAAATLNPDQVAPEEPVPWLLTHVFGVERVEWSALAGLGAPPKERQGEDAAAWAHLTRGDAVPVVTEPPLARGTYAADTWCDHLRLEGATAWARFAEGGPAGSAPAIAVNPYGQGRAVYVAAVIEPALIDALFAQLIGPHDGVPRSDSPPVEVVSCTAGGKPVHFVLNHAEAPAAVDLPRPMRDLLIGQRIASGTVLPGWDVWVLSDET